MGTTQQPVQMNNELCVHELLPTGCQKKARMDPSVKGHAIFAAPAGNATKEQLRIPPRAAARQPVDKSITRAHAKTTRHVRITVDLVRVRVRRHVVENDSQAARKGRDLLVQPVQVEAALCGSSNSSMNKMGKQRQARQGIGPQRRTEIKFH